MSVFIKGMEMPDKCGHCRFATAFECEVTKNFITTFNVRQQDCPLVTIPPHGRLIDADELHSALRKRAKEFSDSEYGDGVRCGLADAREYIKIATTVIPAEDGE